MSTVGQSDGPTAWLEYLFYQLGVRLSQFATIFRRHVVPGALAGETPLPSGDFDWTHDDQVFVVKYATAGLREAITDTLRVLAVTSDQERRIQHLCDHLARHVDSWITANQPAVAPSEASWDPSELLGKIGYMLPELAPQEYRETLRDRLSLGQEICLLRLRTMDPTLQRVDQPIASPATVDGGLEWCHPRSAENLLHECRWSINQLVPAQAASGLDVPWNPQHSPIWMRIEQGLKILRAQVGVETVPPKRLASLDPPNNKPSWDKSARLLSFGGETAKQFRQEAPRVCAVLDAFQQAQWPASISSPVPREKIGDTVRSLITKLSLLEFRQVGDRIFWEEAASQQER